MNITQPRWKEPEYSKREINDAGNVIRNMSSSSQKKEQALQIIDNWRAAHAYPMHVFYMNLKRQTGSRSNIIVVERLKRLNSIVSKLQREEGMELYRMQDLGGCRMIVPKLDEVYTYSGKIIKSRIRHEKKKEDDYIQQPKKSGYRSLHVVYRFYTDTPEKHKYNEMPMLIELQFRTHLQHIWATAVETIGLFTNQALKAGSGDDEIKRFFVLVSSIFALREGCPVVPGTSENEAELIAEIRQIDTHKHLLEMLKAIRVAMLREDQVAVDKKGYYILQLNYENHTLRRFYFKPSDSEYANMMYDRLEAEKRDQPLDTVLVRASSFDTVKTAYPNYFMDIGEFVGIINEYLA